MSAFLAALATASLVASPTTAAAAVDAPKAIPDAAKFALTVDLTSMAEQVAQFERRLGSAPVPVSRLVASTGTRSCDTRVERSVVRSITPAPVALRCWSGRNRTENFMPQGITSTSDASPTNFYDGRQALAVTSYQRGTNEARVSFLPNFGNESHLNIRLVTPTGPGGGNARCHAGGSVWYQHHLIVACTGTIKVFDWRKIYQVGNQHIMVQVGTITGGAVGRFSSVGLDRASDPDLLVVSRWSTSCASLDSPQGNRCSVFRFALPDSGALTSGTLPTYDAFNTAFTSMQGAVSRGDLLWFSSSAGEQGTGTLRSWTRGDGRPVREKPWTVGAESVSYWNRGDGTGVLLNVTEYPSRRVILAVEASNYP
ncbi:hypothetical protein ADK67_33855 [Saccharothrix sp. NRRL B-16348]|nr:hypothetical protein ADK67_33855 [Saccharothrix sp. NRRL B-16348]